MGKEQYDIFEPDRDIIWAGISDKMRRKKQRRRMVVGISVAATVLLAIGLVFPFQTPNDACNELSLADFGKEYKIMEVRYLNEIENFEAIMALENTEINIARELKSEIDYLDSLFCATQPEMKNVPSDDVIIEALIKYYEAKVKMLSRMQMEIERYKIQNKREMASPEI